MPIDDDDSARRRARGSVERLSVPGVPGLRLPPRPVDPEITPPEPYVARRRAREQTRTDWPALPAAALRTQQGASAPPRNLSPSPESQKPVVEVDTGLGKVAFKKKHLRALWIWVAPLVLSALGFIGGAIKGYFVGLAMAHDEIVKIRANQQIDHDKITRLETRADADEASFAQEAQSNRSERATAMRKIEGVVSDLEAVKGGKVKARVQPDLVDAVKSAIQKK